MPLATPRHYPIPVFLQIPKVGGTSLAAIMRENCAPDRFLQVKILEDGPITLASDTEEVRAIRRRVAEAGPTVEAIAAMVPFGIHALLARPAVYFTVVREPIDRCASLWHFMVRRNRPEVAAAGGDLEALLERGLSLSFSNEMTRMLSGSDQPAIDRADFERAVDNVERRVEHIADISRHDRLVEEVARRFAWRKTSGERLNVAGDKPALAGGAVRRLVDLNRWDLELHAWLRDSGRV